jgi:hypothetical protein
VLVTAISLSDRLCRDNMRSKPAAISEKPDGSAGVNPR